MVGEEMMGKIDEAADIIFDTTEKGHKLLEDQDEEDWLNVNPKIDLLLAIEEDYFNAEGSLDEIFGKCQKKYVGIYGGELRLTKVELVEMFTDDLIKIRKVFWTNADLMQEAETKQLE